jgi:hypothetical protein
LSAILKALKKIQHESGGHVRNTSFSKELDAEKALNHRAKKSWLLSRLSAALIIVLVLAAGIVLGFSYGPSFLRGGVFSTVPSEHPNEMENGKTLSAPEIPAPSKGTPAPSDGGAPADGSVPLPAPGERPRISQGPLKARTAPGGVAPPSQENPVLELQAIVWSDDPESSFAVINGRIVRANGMVDGVNVTEIREDAVSLKHDEKVWEIKMLEGD